MPLHLRCLHLPTASPIHCLHSSYAFALTFTFTSLLSFAFNCSMSYLCSPNKSMSFWELLEWRPEETEVRGRWLERKRERGPTFMGFGVGSLVGVWTGRARCLPLAFGLQEEAFAEGGRF